MARKKEKLQKVKLPSGAVVKMRKMSAIELEYTFLHSLIEEFVEPGNYKLPVSCDRRNGFGKPDPLDLLMIDAKFIREWMEESQKTKLDKIRESLDREMVDFKRT